MAVKEAHRRAQRKAAGTTGKIEVPISRGRRLDAATRARAVEVETTGKPDRLRSAAQRLKASGRRQHILVVPHRDISKGRQAMRTVGVTGTVRNLTGTKKSRVSTTKSATRRSRR
jgi:hypothetical protein